MYKNKESYKAYQKAYREKNKAKLAEYRKEYYEQNRDELLKKMSKYGKGGTRKTRKEKIRRHGSGQASLKIRKNMFAMPKSTLKRTRRKLQNIIFFSHRGLRVNIDKLLTGTTKGGTQNVFHWNNLVN